VSAAQRADGVLLLDKPAGFSSTQALGRAKRILAAPKAGHTGTLDPFATGLLPIVFGEATKFSRFLTDAAKTYVATLRLGATSTTGDPEGEVTQTGIFAGDAALIDEVLRRFLGVHEQIPPMHSAVRIAGRRLYELAREGLDVERAARRVEIQKLERRALEGDALVVEVTCSKGTYVRTLATEIGAALGCGAYLTGLRRTGVGPFVLEDAITLEGLAALPPALARARLMAPEVLVRGLRRLDADAAAALRFTQGQMLEAALAAPGDEIAVFGPDGAFLGVGRGVSGGRLSPLRLMATGRAPDLPDFP
jgi:tRNA pseudouridine55 synthase